MSANNSNLYAALSATAETNKTNSKTTKSKTQAKGKKGKKTRSSLDAIFDACGVKGGRVHVVTKDNAKTKNAKAVKPNKTQSRQHQHNKALHKMIGRLYSEIGNLPKDQKELAESIMDKVKYFKAKRTFGLNYLEHALLRAQVGDLHEDYIYLLMGLLQMAEANAFIRDKICGFMIGYRPEDGIADGLHLILLSMEVLEFQINKMVRYLSTQLRNLREVPEYWFNEAWTQEARFKADQAGKALNKRAQKRANESAKRRGDYKSTYHPASFVIKNKGINKVWFAIFSEFVLKPLGIPTGKTARPAEKYDLFEAFFGQIHETIGHLDTFQAQDQVDEVESEAESDAEVEVEVDAQVESEVESDEADQDQEQEDDEAETELFDGTDFPVLSARTGTGSWADSVDEDDDAFFAEAPAPADVEVETAPVDTEAEAVPTDAEVQAPPPAPAAVPVADLQAQMQQMQAMHMAQMQQAFTMQMAQMQAQFQAWAQTQAQQ